MTINQIEKAISDIGDSSVLMAVTLTAAIYFFVCRDFREAIAILSSLAIASASIAILKLFFLSCGHGYLNISSPSGHSALSVAVYGTYPFLIAPRVSPRFRILTFVVFYALAITIVYTRVALHFHSGSEAILGLIVGGITIALVKFFILDGKLGEKFYPRFNVKWLLILTVAVITIMHGTSFPAEKMIQSTARHIRLSGICR